MPKKRFLPHLWWSCRRGIWRGSGAHKAAVTAKNIFCKISWEHKLSKLRISYDILKMYLLSDHIRKLTQRSSLVQTRCQVLHRSQGCRSSTEEPSPEGHLGNTWAQIIMKGTQGYIAENIDNFLVKRGPIVHHLFPCVLKSSLSPSWPRLNGAPCGFEVIFEWAIFFIVDIL